MINMDTQSESCEPPPCDPQPPGKIRKAFKLFSKRKPGSSVASIFSMRGKGEGGPKSPPSRSKTLDGLAETVAPEAEAESLDLDQEDSQKEDVPMEEPTSTEGNLASTPTRQSISSITSAKSLSFLNMLRRSRRGGGGERQAQTESQRPGRQRKGLKGLFGSVRWHGKDKEGGDEVAPGPPLLASRSNSVEIIKENLTLTPRPALRSPNESETEQPPPPSLEEPTSSEDTAKVSESAKPPTNDRLSTLLGDISSILSFDSLTGGGDIVADVEAEWVKVSSRVEEGTDETTKKDKGLSAAVSTKLKPTLSPKSTLSSTFLAKPSPTSTTKLLSSSTSTPKPASSPTTKPTLSPAQPSPTTSVKSTPSPISTSTPSQTTRPDPLSPPTPASSPIPLTKPSPTPITKPMQSPPTTPTLTIPAKPAPIPTSTPLLELATKPSSTPSLPAVPSPATISETEISPTVKSSPDSAGPASVRIEPTPAATATTKPTPTPAPTTTARHSHSASQETKPSSAPAPKYPPFSTSTKPAPTGPVTRPKIVTTFGLSTSRNTAPIVKPETKQPAPPTKSSPPFSQTDKSGSMSATTKPLTSESGPFHAAKPPPVASPPPYVLPVTKPQATISKPTPETAIAQSVPAISSATSAKATCKPEPADTSLLSGSPPLSVQTTSPRPLTTTGPSPVPSSTTPRGGKEQEDVPRRRLVEDTGVHTRPQKLEPQPAAHDQYPVAAHKPEKKSSTVKPTTLSKIPVCGGGRPKQHHRDGQSNGSEEHWNLPTPVHEEGSPMSLSRESSSKEALSDFSTASGAVTPTLSHSQDDILDSAACPTMGVTSLPRESKIPIKHGSTATYHSLQGKTEAARSKIPVAKVPVRRTSNKPAPTATAAATRK